MGKLKYLKKLLINCNWKIKYNNLKKKYDEQEEKIKLLEKQLDKDLNIKKIKEKDNLLIRYKKIIDNLRNDYKELSNKLKENERHK